jgi:glycosyltransferase involved in cell wall biosynthesis
LPDGPLHILLTGTFYSDNWLETHLRPLAQSRRVGLVTMVAATPVPGIPGVTGVYPAPRLERMLGKSTARLLTFIRVALRTKPDVVGGFHLLINGLVAEIVARASGRRSLYICGGGIREIEGGGYDTENKIYQKLGTPSPYVEQKLLQAATQFDYLVTMGQGVRDFFVQKGASGQVVVVPGGFDAELFSPASGTKSYDLVLVGRLSPVKRVDIYIEILKRLEDRELRAVVVGDGPSRRELQELADNLKVGNRIDFVGWQSDVRAWLQKSRIFLLTSQSEGLSQAMVQAMLCGLPAVVSDVGDLKDLVQDGSNGFLVTPGNIDEFAARVALLCADDALRASMGEKARADALRLSMESVAGLWDDILSEGMSCP